MKKILAALLASVFIIPALATSATAGDEYPGTVNTRMAVKAPNQVRTGQVFTVKSTLKVASSSSSTCKGKLRVVVRMGERAKVRGGSIAGGKTKSFKFSLRTQGTWTITSSYTPKASSPCKGSSKSRTITVG